MGWLPGKLAPPELLSCPSSAAPCPVRQQQNLTSAQAILLMHTEPQKAHYPHWNSWVLRGEEFAQHPRDTSNNAENRIVPSNTIPGSSPRDKTDNRVLTSDYRERPGAACNFCPRWHGFRKSWSALLMPCPLSVAF